MQMNREMQQMEIEYREWVQQEAANNKGTVKGNPWYLKGGNFGRSGPYGGGKGGKGGGGGGGGCMANGFMKGKGKGGLFGPGLPIAQEFNCF